MYIHVRSYENARFEDRWRVCVCTSSCERDGVRATSTTTMMMMVAMTFTATQNVHADTQFASDGQNVNVENICGVMRSLLKKVFISEPTITLNYIYIYH